MTDLTLAMSDAARWLIALADDGPDLTINAHKKAAHEALELAAEPSLEEVADVLICLVGVVVHRRWSFSDVADAVNRKVAVNAAWMWEQRPDGTWQHLAVSGD